METLPGMNKTTLLPAVNPTDLPPLNESVAGTKGNSLGQTIVTSLIGFVIVAGLLGNVLVIATICGKRSMKTPCNLFLMNIAIADLLVAILLAPLRVAEQFHGWPLGEFLCQFFGPLQDVIVSVSIITHTIIALERYRGIVTPFKQKLSLYKVKVATPIIWVACYLATGLPLALVLKQNERGGKKLCLAQWPSTTSRRIFEVYLVTFFIVLPLIIQTATYSMIVATIKRQDVPNQSVSRSGTIEQQRNQLRKKARLVKMLIILVVVFQLCYIPRGIFMLLYEFVSAEYHSKHKAGLVNASISTIILYYLKHVINPFILFAMSTEFRKNCYLKSCRKDGIETSSVTREFSGNSGLKKNRFKEEKTSSIRRIICLQDNKGRETNV